MCSFHAKVQAENTGIAYEFLCRLRVAVVQTQLLPTLACFCRGKQQTKVSPRKIDVKHKDGRWEDDFPLQLYDWVNFTKVSMEVIVTIVNSLFYLVTGRIQPTYL